MSLFFAVCMIAEVLIVALARILREDWKKSIDLTTNLVYCFYCFTVFSQFHHVIQENKVRTMLCISSSSAAYMMKNLVLINAWLFLIFNDCRLVHL